jgi:hypothetical protein
MHCGIHETADGFLAFKQNQVMQALTLGKAPAVHEAQADSGDLKYPGCCN